MATEIMNGEVPVQNGDIDSTELEAEMNEDVDAINGLEDPAKPIRLIRKAKRLHRANSGGDATPVNGQTVEKIPALKNSRKSRDGRGRGEPKKGMSVWVIFVVRVLVKYSFISAILLAHIANYIDTKRNMVTIDGWTV